jgi:hypothetical protein
MPINLGSIKNELLPGLRALTGKYDQIPREWDQIFDVGKSEMALERTVEMAYLGYAQLKTEGAATTFDNAAGERFTYNQEHTELALGYAITRKAVDDNLYKRQFNPANLNMMQSFNQTQEILAANVLNIANVYNAQVGGDGVSLVNAAHPIDGGTYSNTFATAADLNESSLLNGMIQIRTGFLDQRGLKMYARGRKLVIPPQLEPVALRLLKTQLRPGTADNDVNAIMWTGGGLKDGYLVDDYLTSPYAWFLLTNIPGLLYLERVPFEMDMQVDFTTDNLLVKGYTRFSYSYYTPRAIFGTFPTS